jgi:hypothetical protein
MAYQAALLHRDARGKTRIHLADEVLVGDSKEEIQEEFEFARGPQHVGYVYFNTRTYEYGEEVLDEAVDA